jgi:galactose mutarotase-like enzyme
MNRLSNSQLTVIVQPDGAELRSIQDAAGSEYLWQADPAIWNRHAPILFPIIGKLRNGHYELDGKTFSMPKHGFARTSIFQLIDKKTDQLVFLLAPSDETRACYPFEFALTVSYSLIGNALHIQYAVRNTGSSLMPFSIGAHPGFTLPSPIDDCFLEFEQEETLTACLLSDSGLLSEETVPVLQKTNRLPLSETLFDRDALIFLNMESEKITLGSKNSRRRLTVEFPGFPQLGIWAKPGAPFVCIEPWFGVDDPESPYGDFTNKPGIQQLPAGETFTCEHRIIIESSAP